MSEIGEAKKLLRRMLGPLFRGCRYRNIAVFWFDSSHRMPALEMWGERMTIDEHLDFFNVELEDNGR